MHLSSLPETDRVPDHYLPGRCFGKTSSPRHVERRPVGTTDDRPWGPNESSSLLFRTSHLFLGDLAEESMIDVSVLAPDPDISDEPCTPPTELPWSEWNEMQKS